MFDSSVFYVFTHFFPGSVVLVIIYLKIHPFIAIPNVVYTSNKINVIILLKNNINVRVLNLQKDFLKYNIILNVCVRIMIFSTNIFNLRT